MTEHEISTTDYESLLRVKALTNNDTWQLFFDMQRFNPFAKKIREELMKSLEKLNERILSV
ncbi:MAG: hypothetical protein AAB408_05595 [Patescibacteria group bacterium]